MGIGFRELLIILVIALILFGAKKLRNVGSDLGAAVRGFKRRQRMFLGYSARAVVGLSHRDAECSLAKSWPDQKGRPVTLRFTRGVRFCYTQFAIRLNPRKASRPNARSFSNI